MKLNTLQSAPGARKKGVRVGRGQGSGLGKTCGRGHKGQKSRKSGGVRPGFEGGQMPLYRRLAKYGFRSRIGRQTAEVNLESLAAWDHALEVNIETLRSMDFINHTIKFVKIFGTAELKQPIKVVGIRVSAGAQKLIEAAGGSVA
jgi:large subunit ribosomal protein L15